MVFGWLFGERKKQESGGPEVGALLTQADEATNARDLARGESLCREVLKQAPGNADAWTMLGVNLIRRNAADSELRAQAVVAWMRALALRPGDSRAADHLQAEIQYPDELIAPLVTRLNEQGDIAEDAAQALGQIGAKARPALDAAAKAGGPGADRAKTLLATLG